jgi:hypothetical protein
MTAFMDKFDEMRGGVLMEQQNTKSLIVGLLEHIGRGLDDATNLPDAEVLGEMEDAKAFKERNLATAQKYCNCIRCGLIPSQNDGISSNGKDETRKRISSSETIGA